MIRLVGCAMIFVAVSNCVSADNSIDKVREGMRHYSAAQYEEASKSFAAATKSLEKAKSDKSAIAAYDEACALHRKGDFDLARERYLKAGLSHDKVIATNSHFNMGVIASEQARKIAGETPETVPSDKRKEILNELSRSIDSYRHCLELQPQHAPARRNLELLRQWIKYHTDRWREADLQKRRDETNLIQFLEYLFATELSLKKMAEDFRSNTSPNAYAELKRVQDELREEIPYLKEKIESELRPRENDPSTTTSNANSAQDQQDLERGIELLKGWADEAGDKMAAAGRALMKREATTAAEDQQRAADQLDQIWDAIVPFHPLLAKELAEQTQVATKLSPPENQDDKNDKDPANDQPTESLEPENAPQKLEVNDRDWTELREQQERTLRKTRLLGPKAESELGQFEKLPKADETSNFPVPDDSDITADAGQKIDPEAIKAGYQKAMELAPKAVEEMEAVVKMLDKRDREQAATHAEEARVILKEIQDAQPKNPDQDKNQQQENKDKDKDKNKKEDENKDSKDEQKNSDDQKQDKQQEEKKKSDEEKKDQEQQAERQQEPKVSKDRIEEALRRVREREQEKRERDRELKARVLGRVPVDKDW